MRMWIFLAASLLLSVPAIKADDAPVTAQEGGKNTHTGGGRAVKAVTGDTTQAPAVTVADTATIDGMLHLRVGQQSDTVFILDIDDPQNGRNVKLPFAVRLDALEITRKEDEPAVYIFVPDQKAPITTLNVREGEEVTVRGSRVRILGVTGASKSSDPLKPISVGMTVEVMYKGERWLLQENQPSASTEIIFLLARRKRLALDDVISTLSLLDRAGVLIKTQTIHLNQWLQHDDWWLYNSAWDPSDLEYIGIQVRDAPFPQWPPEECGAKP